MAFQQEPETGQKREVPNLHEVASSPDARPEWIAAVLLSALVLFMALVSATHKGALWRDEVNSVEIAEQTTISEVWSLRAYDSCPTLYHMILRGWIRIGFGSSHASLRTLGVLAVACVVASIWIAGFAVAGRPPVLALALLGLLPAFIRYAGSNRAYGFGIASSILAFAAVWTFVDRPRRGTFLAMLLAAMLSVSLLYQNSFLLLSICLSGMLVAASRRAWNVALLILAAGAAAAACLLPYIGVIRQVREMDVLLHSIIKDPAPHVMLLRRLFDVLGSAHAWIRTIWLMTAAVAVVFTLWRLFINRSLAPRSLRTDRAAYASGTMIICAVATTYFYLQTGYTIQSWHLLGSIALTAICVEIAFANLFRLEYRWESLVIACAVVSLAVPELYEIVKVRHTNMDSAAEIVSDLAQPDDLVIVLPYHPAVTFQRYYHGKAPWTIVPAIGHPPVHRADLVKKKMASDHPIDDVLLTIQQTLEQGRTVWLVEQSIFSFAIQSKPPPIPPKPPLARYGWSEQPYNYSWSRQVHYFLQRGSAQNEGVRIPSHGRIDGIENIVVRRFSGVAPGEDP